MEMAFISILNVCGLQETMENVDIWVDKIMTDETEGKSQDSVTKELFVENSMKLDIIKLGLQRPDV